MKINSKEFQNLQDLEDLTAESLELKKRAIIFELACAWYGFLLKDTHTVFQPTQVTPLPNSPEFIIGLTNYRNEIIPIIDLRKKLTSTHPTYSSSNRIIKVAFREMSLGFFIENIVEPVQYGRYDIKETSTSVVTDIPHGWVLEVIELNNQDCFILDMPTVLRDLYDEIHHKSSGS